MVDDEGVHGLFHEVFRGFHREISAKASLFDWIQGSLLLWIDSGSGSWAGILREVGGTIC